MRLLTRQGRGQALLVAAAILVVGVQAVGAQTWKFSENITATLKGGTLTFSGKGPIPTYTNNDISRVNDCETCGAPGPLCDFLWKRISSAKVVIGNGVSSFEWNFLGDFSSLTTITIGSGVTEIIGGASSGERLTAINVDPKNANYSSIDGVLFNKDQTILILYPAGKKIKEYTIPNSVTSFEWDFFKYSYSLTTITIGSGVSEISNISSGCSDKLTAINVDPNNANYSSIDGVLFNKDQTILILYPAGKKIKEYTIPNSVTSIDKGAFSYDSLKSIIVKKTTPPKLDAKNWFSVACTLYVLQGSVSDTTVGWNQFKHIGYMDSTGGVLKVVSANGRSFAEDQKRREDAVKAEVQARETINTYEKQLAECGVQKNAKCENVMYMLGTLYITAERRKAKPDYATAIATFQRFLNEYPTSNYSFTVKGWIEELQKK